MQPTITDKQMQMMMQINANNNADDADDKRG
jgi:hypothetical protein